LAVVEEPLIWFLDEPDMALSIRSCHWLAITFKEAADRGQQIIAAVHNPILIASVDQVYSVEHRCWMDSADFIKAHSGGLCCAAPFIANHSLR
jgi:predicted ATPase